MVDLSSLSLLYLVLIYLAQNLLWQSIIPLSLLHVLWLIAFYLFRLHEVERDLSLRNQLLRVFRANTYFGIVSFIAWSIYETAPLSSQRFFQLLLIYAAITLLWRCLLHGTLGYYRKKGYNLKHVAIMGYSVEARYLAVFFKANPELGYVFHGFYDPETQPPQSETLNNVREAIQQHKIDILYFCLQNYNAPQFDPIIQLAQKHRVKIKLLPEAHSFRTKHVMVKQYGHLSILDISHSPLENELNRILKRSFDILFAALVIICVLSWLTPLMGLLIKLTSKGPIFFKQARQGLNSKTFHCYKFRSMHTSEEANVKQACKNDPRVTRLGKWLRKYSIDEMPQFLNVLRGDMSVIGPRPHTAEMNQMFSSEIERFRERHSVKPGITGLAQIKGLRGEVKKPYEIKGRIRVDRFYVRNWSFLLDLKIVLLTPFAFFKHMDKAY